MAYINMSENYAKCLKTFNQQVKENWTTVAHYFMVNLYILQLRKWFYSVI